MRLTFIGHATFLIESPTGVTIETDYNDYVRSGRVPTIATMNRAHSTHYASAPDPGTVDPGTAGVRACPSGAEAAKAGPPKASRDKVRVVAVRRRLMGGLLELVNLPNLLAEERNRIRWSGQCWER